MSRARDFADLAGSADAGGITGKNLIINGAMQVAARGTQTNQTSAYTACDRFDIAVTGAAIMTTSQDTTIPSGQGFSNSLKIDVTTADSSLAADDLVFLRHKIEGQNLQHLLYGTSDAKKITLSFWVRSPKTGTHIIELRHAAINYFNSQVYTINTADTWQNVTVTFDGYTATAIGNDNGVGLTIDWWLAAGSTYSGGTLSSNTWHNTQANRAVGQVNVVDDAANNFYITGVQLEVGTATPFEHRSYGDELLRCQRYYYNTYITPQSSGSGSNGLQAGTFNANDRYNVDNFFPVEMRSQPTVVYYGGRSGSSNTADRVSRYNSDTLRSFVNEPNVTVKGIRGYFDTDSNDFAIKYHFTANAEL
jgi:hypothetical protein